MAKAMLTECTGAEVAEDRRHVSIVAAGEVDGYVAVEVAAYVSGSPTPCRRCCGCGSSDRRGRGRSAQRAAG
jgi:hypothetical protein